MHIRAILVLCCVLFLNMLWSSMAYAEATEPLADFQAGIHYHILTVLPEHQPVIAELKAKAAPKQVQVLEFFSYGCGACFLLEPSLLKWRKQLSSKVHFERIPVLFHQQWRPYSKAFYTLKALQAEELSSSLFQAVHQYKQPLLEDIAMVRFLQKLQPQQEDAIKALYNSFSVDKQIRSAMEQAKALRVTAIPQIIVVGKNTVIAIENRLPGGAPEILAVTSKVLEEQLENSN